MKRFILITLIVFMGHWSFGQNTTTPREKIESARIALITQRLGLTPAQAEKFWPIYNEFRQKTQALKAEYDQAKVDINPQTATDQEKRELLNLGLKLKERKVQLERQYANRLLNVISTEQIMSLRKAEDDFRRMLLEQIQKRRLQDGRRNQIRDRLQERKNGN